MSSHVIEWAREKIKELQSVTKLSQRGVWHRQYRVELHEGMLVRGAHSHWEETRESLYGHKFSDYGYKTFTEDIYVLLSKCDSPYDITKADPKYATGWWRALTPKDGVQTLHEDSFVSIDAIPFWQSEEDDVKQYNEWWDSVMEEWCIPGLDYEEAS